MSEREQPTNKWLKLICKLESEDWFAFFKIYFVGICICSVAFIVEKVLPIFEQESCRDIFFLSNVFYCNFLMLICQSARQHGRPLATGRSRTNLCESQIFVKRCVFIRVRAKVHLCLCMTQIFVTSHKLVVEFGFELWNLRTICIMWVCFWVCLWV